MVTVRRGSRLGVEQVIDAGRDGLELEGGLDLQAGRLGPEHRADRLPRGLLRLARGGRLRPRHLGQAALRLGELLDQASPGTRSSSRWLICAISARILRFCCSISGLRGRDMVPPHRDRGERKVVRSASRFRSSPRRAGGRPGRRGGHNSGRRCARPRVPPSRHRGASRPGFVAAVQIQEAHRGGGVTVAEVLGREPDRVAAEDPAEQVAERLAGGCPGPRGGSSNPRRARRVR